MKIREVNKKVNTEETSRIHFATDILNIRTNICNTFLIVSSIVALPVLIASLMRTTHIGWQPVMILQIAFTCFLFFIVVFRNKLSFVAKAVYIICMLFLLGVSGIIQFGMIAGSTVFLVAAAPMATLFFGGRAGLVVLFISITSTVILAYLVVSGLLVPAIDLETYVVMPLNWVGKIMAWFLVSLGISVSIHVFNGKLINSLKLSEKHQQDLKQHQANLEKIVEERTAELLRSNQSLERFARIAAHDMKSPLNAIAAHAQLIDIDLSEREDKELKENIKNILDSTYIVSSMINDLLDYSRLNKDAGVPDIIDMNIVLEITKRQLVTEIEAAGVTLTHDELPAVEAVEIQLIRVMQNIIANAIKYRNKEKTPTIHISSQRNNDEWVISIRDNGIGIPAEQTESIFDIFHQIDSREYEGSGIGLASCKKIIERHGGKIWVESEPGEGSTFFFSLKAA